MEYLNVESGGGTWRDSNMRVADLGVRVSGVGGYSLLCKSNRDKSNTLDSFGAKIQKRLISRHHDDFQ